MKKNCCAVAIIVALCICFFASGCTRTAIIPEEENLAPEVLFCWRDDCEQRFVELAENAESIVCAFYELDSEKVRKVLLEKNARVVLDDKTTSRQMHNKFCVFDNEVVWTGSFNPRTGSKKFDNVVVLYSKFIAQNYAEEFEELSKGIVRGKKVRTPAVVLNGNLVENFFCPEDSCKERVLAELGKAESRIYFMAFSFTDDDIGELLLEKSKAIEVRGLFDKSQNSRWSEYERLRGFSSRISGLHHKVFIVDNETVITGSYNPTKNGNERNDENILIIHDKSVAELFADEFFILSGRAS